MTGAGTAATRTEASSMNTKAPHFTLWACAAGIVAAGLGVAAGELAAALLSPSLSPVSAVGSVVIDGMPAPVKDWAIGLFGTADKVAFLVSMAVVIAVAAAAAGMIDDVCDPAQTRKYVIAALEMLSSKRDSNPPKKHGNLPL